MLCCDVLKMFEKSINFENNGRHKSALSYEDETYTYGWLSDSIELRCKELANKSVQEGDIIAISAEDLVMFLICFFSVIKIGAIVLPIFEKQKYQNFLEEVNIRFLIEFDANKKMIFSENTNFNDGKGLPDWIVQNETSVPAVIFPTSGTSGSRSKLVVQSRQNLAETVTYINREMAAGSGMCEFIGSPPSNVFWLGRVRCCLAAGGHVVLDKNSSNPLQLFSTLNRYQINSLSGDTSFFVVLIEYYLSRLKKFGQDIKWVKLSSQAIGMEHLNQLMSVFTEARITMGYGLTEAMRSSLISYRDYGSDKWSSVGCVGKNGVNIVVLNADGDVCECNEVGEIFVHGGNVAMGYLNNESLSKSRFKNNGFFTGDCGFVDDDGFLYFSSRNDTIINCGGVKIFPDLVEKCFDRSFPTSSYCVLAIKDPKGIRGDVAVLVVEEKFRRQVGDVDRFLERVLAGSDYKSVVHSVFFIEAIPRSSNGKVKHGVLRTYVEGQI